MYHNNAQSTVLSSGCGDDIDYVMLDSFHDDNDGCHDDVIVSSARPLGTASSQPAVTHSEGVGEGGEERKGRGKSHSFLDGLLVKSKHLSPQSLPGHSPGLALSLFHVKQTGLERGQQIPNFLHSTVETQQLHCHISTATHFLSIAVMSLEMIDRVSPDDARNLSVRSHLRFRVVSMATRTPITLSLWV